VSGGRPDDNLFVLDTSAVLALLEGEHGAQAVRDIIARGSAVLPWIAALELHYITGREVSTEEADARLVLLRSAGVAMRTMDGDRLLRQASALKAAFPISLADALIAAVAVTENATLVHKDPEYETLTGHVRMLALPFKPRGRAGERPGTT
jgi:predicted nucleic acid-binding protein